MKTTTLPNSAVDYESWLAHVVDLITACARDPNEAMSWVTRITKPGAMFEDMGTIPPNMVSLDAKIRSAISKHCTSSDASGGTPS